jgi:hypothetical protein
LSFQEFEVRLKNHLYSRICHLQEDEDFPTFSESQRQDILIHNDRIYYHSRMRVFYTTYDLRRAYDPIDLRNRPNVMTAAYHSEETTICHPFWYARVLGIYHADIRYRSGPRQRMDFLWVRWYSWDQSNPGGWENTQLDRVTFDDIDHQFGFLDPAAVIRGAHLIPAWAHGQSHQYPNGSAYVPMEGDWLLYYVNR